MAEYFEEVETKRIFVQDLIEVTNYGSMTVGDLIVVNNSTRSVRFGKGLDNQVLSTDTSTDTHLAWKNVSNLLGFNGSGELLVSVNAGDSTVLEPGTNGQVLQIVNGFPTWTTQAANLKYVLYNLQTDEIRHRIVTNKFAYFKWDDSMYGTGGMNLTAGVLTFFATVATGATGLVEFNRESGTGPTSLCPPIPITASGIIEQNITTNITSDNLYVLSATLTTTGGNPVTTAIRTFDYSVRFNYT